MKTRATVTLRRKASGEVVGEIVNERGKVDSKSFGIMTEDEFRRCVKKMEKEFPDVGAIEVFELTGN